MRFRFSQGDARAVLICIHHHFQRSDETVYMCGYVRACMYSIIHVYSMFVWTYSCIFALNTYILAIAYVREHVRIHAQMHTYVLFALSIPEDQLSQSKVHSHSTLKDQTKKSNHRLGKQYSPALRSQQSVLGCQRSKFM